MRRLAAGISVVALLLCGGIAPATAFAVKFSWAGIAACSSGSPAFALSKIPAGTARLRFTLHDKDAPDFVHGGGEVAYTGGADVPAGAFTYTGPCPPPGARHHYAWTIVALDTAGAVLATTTAAKPFP